MHRAVIFTFLGLIFWGAPTARGQSIFADGFESGDTCRWSSTVTVETCDGRDNNCDGVVDELPCIFNDDCDLPASPASTAGAHVVGTGTAASCTEAALDDAFADLTAAAIVFDCGPQPHTIVVTSEKVVDRDLTIDGGGLITLSGGGASRILKVYEPPSLVDPLLTVQHLSLVDGFTGDLGGAGVGAAIMRLGGSLTVVDCWFENNVGPVASQAVVGGAIYSQGVGATVIVDSVFLGNQCASGGAIGALGLSDLQIVHSTIRGNAATGLGGTSGTGGNGGGIYWDGADMAARVCGALITDNGANAPGGGFFGVSNSVLNGAIFDYINVSNNLVSDTAESVGGGLYLNGLHVEMNNTSVTGNTANLGGGIFFSSPVRASTFNATNCTVAANYARGWLGAGVFVSGDVTGTLWQVTIAENWSDDPNSWAAAIQGGQELTLKNTLIADNTAPDIWGDISCSHQHPGLGPNYQWPDENTAGQPELPCTPGSMFADPLLGDLGYYGGVSPTILPQPGSPVLGTATDCPPTDQRGYPRNPAACTPGATEPQP